MGNRAGQFPEHRRSQTLLLSSDRVHPGAQRAASPLPTLREAVAWKMERALEPDLGSHTDSIAS